jgi:hypothetical protein
MYMRTSLNSRDYRHPYVDDVFQNLNALIMNLAPNAGIADVAERRKINLRDEVSARARQDYDLVCSVLPDPVKGIDKRCMVLGSEPERPSLGVELGHEHTTLISGQLETRVLRKI